MSLTLHIDDLQLPVLVVIMIQQTSPCSKSSSSCQSLRKAKDHRHLLWLQELVAFNRWFVSQLLAGIVKRRRMIYRNFMISPNPVQLKLSLESPSERKRNEHAQQGLAVQRNRHDCPDSLVRPFYPSPNPPQFHLFRCCTSC